MTVDNIHAVYNTNILIIVMNLIQLVKEIPHNVVMYLLNEDKEGLSQQNVYFFVSLDRFRKKLYWGLALAARENNDSSKVHKYE